MAFSEKVKIGIRKKSHNRCCICHSIGVEVHHIIPQCEKKLDSSDNAAPLCPSCHETYGENPKKRKFIKEARDTWFEICEERYGPSSKKLENIEKTLSEIKNILSDKLEVSDNMLDNNFLSYGEVVDFYNRINIEEINGFEICYELAFSSKGNLEDPNDIEFNELRNTFLDNFGIVMAEKMVAFACKSLKIDWDKGVTEDQLEDFFAMCLASMFLLFKHSDLNFEKEKVGFKLNKNKTDIIYTKMQ